MKPTKLFRYYAFGLYKFRNETKEQHQAQQKTQKQIEKLIQEEKREIEKIRKSYIKKIDKCVKELFELWQRK